MLRLSGRQIWKLALHGGNDFRLFNRNSGSQFVSTVRFNNFSLRKVVHKTGHIIFNELPDIIAVLGKFLLAGKFLFYPSTNRLDINIRSPNRLKTKRYVA